MGRAIDETQRQPAGLRQNICQVMTCDPAKPTAKPRAHICRTWLPLFAPFPFTPAFVGHCRLSIKSISDFPARYAQPTWLTLRTRAGKPRGEVQMQLFYTAVGGGGGRDLAWI